MSARPAQTALLPPIVIIGILFFVFGFVSWVNAILIPYFELVCGLTATQAMMVPFFFYISYFIMALPSSYVLQQTGFKNGMVLGLLIMALGGLAFMPAASLRLYPLFLAALFIQATGLTILQTASNPYVTILGPIESAAKRISIMGVCNKVAGALAPIILIHAITNSPDEIDQLKAALPHMAAEAATRILDQLSSRLILPYVIIAVVLIGLALLIRLSHLPDVKEEAPAGDSDVRQKLRHYPYALLGAITIFFAVSAEVLVVDSIIGYGQYMAFSFKDAKYLATYTLLLMILSYVLGILLIPKYLSQQKVLALSGVFGLMFAIVTIFIPGQASVWTLCALGLCNALLWPSIWPLALDGLGNLTKKISAMMIMGISGGAVTPLLYGYLTDITNAQKAYWVLVPCYMFILFYALRGCKIGKK